MGIVIAIMLAVLAAALMLVARTHSDFVQKLANVATIIATLAAIVMLVISYPSPSSSSGDTGPTPTQVANIPPTQSPKPPSATPAPASPTTAPPTTNTPVPTVTVLPPTKTRIPTVVPSSIPTLGIYSTKIAKDGSPMTYVPAGEFLMGSTDADTNAQLWEKPQHRVYLDAFWISRYKVTNALYKKCVDAGRCTVPPADIWRNGTIPAGKENHPVVGVNWNDAITYAQWVGGRLPTEAEWEKAACWDETQKAKRVYPWGNQFDSQKANTRESEINGTTPVGKYSPQGDSPYGLSDMAGNVFEWAGDWYSWTYYASSPRNNPKGPDSGDGRVFRGGSSRSINVIARCANRGGSDPAFRSSDMGFRVAESVP